ncbi:MAG: hypothetical protein M3Y79_12395 [Pseudomonadota bacterium]|nr:hypothetical protein [Pseudomonadota bacterium]
MKSSLLLLLVPAAILVGCNRADTPERSDMREAPMSSQSPGAAPGEFRDESRGIESRNIDQNGNIVVTPNSDLSTPGTGGTTNGMGNPGAGTDDANSTRSDIEGTNTTRPDGGSADDARRNQ